MKNKLEIKNIVILLCVLCLLALLYFLFDMLFNSREEDTQEKFLKNYEVNEYIPTYISDENMAKIYLNDYIHNMYMNTEKAYNLIDEEYKEKKFPALDSYISYVKSLETSTYNLERYYVTSKGGYKIFGVYDTNGNIYIFKTNGVMQYTVYLDDYTVEI